MNETAISLRHATSDDAAAVRHVHRASWTVGFVEILSAEMIAKAVPVRCSIEKWNRIFANLEANNESVLLAERDSRAIGFVHFGDGKADRARSKIHRFYVTPAEWGNGSAQMLMDAALHQLAETGQTTVELWTPGTPRARRFYERNGFRPTGVAQDFPLIDGISVADYQFTRSLTAV